MPAAVGIGSNRGDRAARLDLARTRLEVLLEDLSCSAVYETEPVGEGGSRPFLNMCCVGRTELTPAELLDGLQRVEAEAGRPPPGAPGRSGARALDLDLLLYGERRVREPGLTVPHPRMTARAFVLVPLAEVAATWRVPGTGRTVAELAAGSRGAGIERLGTLEELMDRGEEHGG